MNLTPLKVPLDKRDLLNYSPLFGGGLGTSSECSCFGPSAEVAGVVSLAEVCSTPSPPGTLLIGLSGAAEPSTNVWGGVAFDCRFRGGAAVPFFVAVFEAPV